MIKVYRSILRVTFRSSTAALGGDTVPTFAKRCPNVTFYPCPYEVTFELINFSDCKWNVWVWPKFFIAFIQSTWCKECTLLLTIIGKPSRPSSFSITYRQGRYIPWRFHSFLIQSVSRDLLLVEVIKKS